MKVTGITAEYNPLHNGHVYHMQKSRESTNCDALVVAMSGNYVQRGEPALTDKWARTKLALEGGADLVVEIPVLFCLGNASQYASASVRLLEAAGCKCIAFGSECGDSELLCETAGFIRENKEKLEEGIHERIKSGMSYPAARAEVYKTIRLHDRDADTLKVERELSVLNSSNDILALEYIMNMKYAEAAAVRREGAGYSDAIFNEKGFQSARSIRSFLEQGGDPSTLKCFVPSGTYGSIHAGPLTFPGRWTELLRYTVMMKDIDEMEDCPAGGEGLANLLKKVVIEKDQWEDIIKSIKSKRYTYTRISRFCMQIILGITRNKYPYRGPEYIRVLGFTEKGREYLSEIKKCGTCTLPLITNINKERDRLSEDAIKMLELEVHSDDIYNLITGRNVEACSDYRTMPVICK